MDLDRYSVVALWICCVGMYFVLYTVLSCGCPRSKLNWRQSQDCQRLKISKQFCPVSNGGVNWVLFCPDPVSSSQRRYLLWRHLETGSRLVHKCVYTADETGQNCSVSDILKTTDNCLRLSPTQFTPLTPTRQDSLVLSVSAVWTRHYSRAVGLWLCFLIHTIIL